MSDPFDLVVPRRREVALNTFQQASEKIAKQERYLARTIAAVPPKEHPDLIVGHEYDQLEPESEEKSEQDHLDADRFATTQLIGLRYLQTHEERVRAAYAIARRERNVDESAVTMLVSDAEAFIKEQKIKTRYWWGVSLITFFFFADGVSEGRGFGTALGSSLLAFISVLLISWVAGNVWRMGESSGRAV